MNTIPSRPGRLNFMFRSAVWRKDGGEDTPFKVLALLNYPMIDEELGRIAADFWSTGGRKADAAL